MTFEDCEFCGKVVNLDDEAHYVEDDNGTILYCNNTKVK